MSPFMALIFFAVLIGVVVLIVGLALRKRMLILIGTPAALLLLAWYLFASQPPNPDTEFARIFGSSNLSAASGIRIIKPTLMDGYFLSFHMTQADFNSRIGSQFTATDTRSSGLSLLHGDTRPRVWPEWIEYTSSILTTEINGQQVTMVYGSHEQTAYVSVKYEQW